MLVINPATHRTSDGVFQLAVEGEQRGHPRVLVPNAPEPLVYRPLVALPRTPSALGQ